MEVKLGGLHGMGAMLLVSVSVKSISTKPLENAKFNLNREPF